MTKEEIILRNRCELVTKELKNILERHEATTASIPSVCKLLHKTVRRSMEYEGGTFIVLVVGPAKSGKSTLVNLIANAYVSPTHFLECTVRPSIISQVKNGDRCKITVFTSRNKANRIEQIDSIIDYIRGMEGKDSLADLTTEDFELNPDNIREKVELGLTESLSDETLVTSMTTPGGKLMQRDVFLVDMPGFDGYYANIDDPIYDTIAQRADLIVFVQSSNSAISKVSAQFLSKLRENNESVNVCLLHNVFDAAHWRSPQKKEEIIKSQKDFAIKEIRANGFGIEEQHCFSINLGMVEDSRRGEYESCAGLKEEERRFGSIENELYERIISHRDAMSLKICLDRTRGQQDKLLQAIREELCRRKELARKYDDAKAEFERLTRSDDALDSFSCPKINLKAMNDIVRNEFASRTTQIHRDLHFRDSAVRAEILGFVTECERLISAAFREIHSLSQKEKEMHQLYLRSISEITRTAERCSATPAINRLDCQEFEAAVDIKLTGGIDLTYIPHKQYYPFIHRGGHSSEDLVSYLRSAANRLTGYEADGSEIAGYVRTAVVPPLQAKLEGQTKDIVRKYKENYLENLKLNEACVLDGIIADKPEFDETTSKLAALESELTTMKY